MFMAGLLDSDSSKMLTRADIDQHTIASQKLLLNLHRQPDCNSSMAGVVHHAFQANQVNDLSDLPL